MVSLSFIRYTQRQDENFCGICRDPLEPEPVSFFAKTLKYIGHDNHVFHVDCLKEWLERSLDCPFCRQQFSLTSVRSVFERLSSTGFDFKKKWGVVLSGFGALFSLSSYISFQTAPELGGLFLISSLAVQNEKDNVKKIAITITSVAMGALGSTFGLEGPSLVLAGLFGASCSSGFLEQKPQFDFWQE